MLDASRVLGHHDDRVLVAIDSLLDVIAEFRFQVVVQLLARTRLDEARRLLAEIAIERLMVGDRCFNGALVISDN